MVIRCGNNHFQNGEDTNNLMLYQGVGIRKGGVIKPTEQMKLKVDLFFIETNTLV